MNQVTPYQEERVKFLLQLTDDDMYNGGILCDEMGLGKTGVYCINHLLIKYWLCYNSTNAGINGALLGNQPQPSI